MSKEGVPHINMENLEQLWEQEDTLSFWEEIWKAAKKAADICGCRGSCRQEEARTRQRMNDEQFIYNEFFNYIFPGRMKPPALPKPSTPDTNPGDEPKWGE